MWLSHRTYFLGIVIAAGLAVAVSTGELFAEEETFSVFAFIFDVIEKTLVFVGAGGVLLLINQIRSEQRERENLQQEVAIARADGLEWRRRAQVAMEDIGVEIARQLSVWGLSDAEKDIALLVIKGLTHKEIATLRRTSESTVRQQARSVYAKSKLPGRAAFAAFFLEDLLPPSSAVGSQ